MTEYEAWSFLHDYVDHIEPEGLDNWLRWVDNTTSESAINIAKALSGYTMW